MILMEIEAASRGEKRRRIDRILQNSDLIIISLKVGMVARDKSRGDLRLSKK